MPEYLAPGVYIEEISTRSKPIEGVGTSTAGFVGPTERGPHYPVLIGSQLEFERSYGDLLPVGEAFLPFAVSGFFQNGGQRCFVSRVVPQNSNPAQLQLGGLLNISAIGEGEWGSRVRIKVEKSEQSSEGNPRFRISLVYYRKDRDPGDQFIDPLITENLTNPQRKDPDAIEVFTELTHREGDSNNVIKIINANSNLVRCWWLDPANPTTLPPGDFESLANGSDGDGTLVANDFLGNVEPILRIDGQDPPLNEPLGRGTGLRALETVDEVAILLAPDEVQDGLDAVTEMVVTQCEKAEGPIRDRFIHKWKRERAASQQNQGHSLCRVLLSLDSRF